MKKSLSLLALCAMLCACNTNWGALETVNYPINGEWDELEINSAFDVTTSDEVTSAQVTIGEKAQQYVRVEVVNGKLIIGINKRDFSNNRKATVVLPNRDGLESVHVHGASSFSPGRPLEGTDIEVELTGASMFDGAIYAVHTNMKLSGASEATVQGASDELELDASGASKFNGPLFLCDMVECDLSGASRASVTCCGSLDADVSGASKLHYKKKGPDCVLNKNINLTGASSAEEK